MMGTVCTTEAAWPELASMADAFGITVSPDDAYLVQRGIRSLGARLAQHQQSALAVAHWLLDRPEVADVFCPALPHDPNHALWQRDCHGTNGLLSFTAAHRARWRRSGWSTVSLFGIGASLGRFREPGRAGGHAPRTQRHGLGRPRHRDAPAYRPRKACPTCWRTSTRPSPPLPILPSHYRSLPMPIIGDWLRQQAGPARTSGQLPRWLDGLGDVRHAALCRGAWRATGPHAVAARPGSRRRDQRHGGCAALRSQPRSRHAARQCAW